MPFIHEGDLLKIVPLESDRHFTGKTIAITHPRSKSLVIHRVVASRANHFLVKADNSSDQFDGWIDKEQILGRLARIERSGKNISFGLGTERYLIAFFSRYGILTRLISLARKIRQVASRDSS